MSRFEAHVDVDADGLAESIHKQIVDGIQNSRKDIHDGIEEAAQERLERKEAIWRGEVHEGFEMVLYREGKNHYVRTFNISEHAPYVEWGAKPHRPPIIKLLPWVRSNLSDYGVADGITAGSVLTDGGGSGSYPRYTQEEVDAAYNVQEAIAARGLHAVRYMFVAERWAKRHAPRKVAENISQSLNTNL